MDTIITIRKDIELHLIICIITQNHVKSFKQCEFLFLMQLIYSCNNNLSLLYKGDALLNTKQTINE